MILAGDQYIEGYGYSDMERVMWADPNYLGGVIGMGGMIAALLLFQNNNSTLKIFLGIALLIAITALVRNASRGALLAIISGVSILFLGGKLKLWKKIIILAVMTAFIYILYNSSYFDLLEYRLENDTGGGSGRIGIWMNKWNAYINNSSIFQLLFGMGYDNGYKAGFSYNRAFHNDFLAFLVDYGLVGFIAFLSLFFYPLKGFLFKNKAVLGCVVYLFVNCMLLEPFSLGVLQYYVFWLYIFYLAMYYKGKHNSYDNKCRV
jgi:O-antigen ligase